MTTYMKPKREVENPEKPAVENHRVTAEVWPGGLLKIDAAVDAQSGDFTEDVFEDALDKASRPLKGRLAHVPYSSEDFIKEKREEAELEDRPS